MSNRHGTVKRGNGSPVLQYNDMSFLEQIENALKMVAGGAVWSCFGAFFGTALEFYAARANNRKMGFIDIAIAYAIAFFSGTMVWLYVSGTGLEENAKAYMTMAGCLFGREAGPMLTESVRRLFRK